MSSAVKIDEIKKLAELMSKHDVTEISIEGKDSKLKIKRANGFEGAPAVMMQAPVTAPVAAPAAPAAAPEAAVEAAPAASIDSPLVGTFYEAAAPDTPPFVKVGDTVTADTVVCIVEAMKVMNEIQAEKSGVIKKVLVENAKPVQFGQPLFEIDPT